MSTPVPESVRGVRGEEAVKHTREENRALRRRSLRLLGSLMKPVQDKIWHRCRF